MSLLRLAVAKVRALFRRNAVADEIRDEMQFHVEMRADEYERQGLAPDDARWAATTRFGNLAVMQDRGYDVRGGGIAETVAQDARYGVRVLGRQPAVTAAIILTLAVAIAANTALFSIFDGLLFRPLPYTTPDAIIRIDRPNNLPGAEFTELQDGLLATSMLTDRAQVSLGGLFEMGTQAVTDWGLAPAVVTPSFFDLLGVRPSYGRAFVADDRDRTNGGPRPLILGHELWRTRFGADPDIVNRVIEIPGTIFRNSWVVVGIMPPGFDFPSGSNLWAPVSQQQDYAPQFARLADGITIEMLQRQFPVATFTPLREYLRPRGAMAFAFLLGATGLLLVVAWVQIAALLFSRAIARGREIGVRLALGASHGRLIRQFGTEAVLVASAALVLSWLMARPLTAFVVRLLPAEITVGQMLEPDSRTLLFTCALSIVGVLLLTLLPAGFVRRTSTTDLLRGGGAGRARTSPLRVRSLLTMTQIAVTAALLYMAGLAVQSFSSVSAAPLGFEPARMVAVRLPVVTVTTRVLEPGAAPVVDREDLSRQMQLQLEVVEAVRSVPGVLHAASAERHPLQTGSPRTQTVTSKAAGSAIRVDAHITNVTAGFAATLGLPLMEGRDATPDDLGDRIGIVSNNSAPASVGSIMVVNSVVLVNQTLARALEPFGPVPGQVITVGNDDYRVLGVIGDFADGRPDQPPRPHVFVPAATAPFVIARLAPDVPGAEAGIRATFDRLWADRASRQIIRIEDEHVRTTADYRARSILLTLLGVLCLPLAIVGLIAAQMDAVRQQTRDIAIRLALGAEPADVRRRVVLRAVATVVGGLALGLAGGIGVGQLMSAYLYGVEALDAASVAIVASLLLGVSLFAALWPASRAARIAPALVLRDQ